MKKVFFTLMCLASIMAAGSGLRAQEVTINLWRGWNWISYLNATSMEVGEALGGFVPMEGDVIKSQEAVAEYRGGLWTGSLTHLMPGKGYMYCSARTAAVSFVFAQAASNVVATATPTDVTAMSAVVGGMVTLPEGGHVFLRGVCWGTEPNPDIDGSHTSEETGMASFNRTLDSLTPNTTYYVRAYVVWDSGLEYGDEVNFITLDDGSGSDHGYVDLGLPSGLLWATCNVGATTPEEYGDYFAWGETQPKDVYDWTTYQYCNGSNYTLTKYCNSPSYGYNGFTDDLTTLLPEDDAATANWGNDWRMPTKEEWQELYNNTTWIWTTQNGVNGRLFIASNGNSLFLPAAGFHKEGSFSAVGSYGFYCSSSLYTDYPIYEWNPFFHSGNCCLSSGLRMDGYSVRAVHSSGQNNAPTGAIDGKFTINADGDQVYFSQGNLQYIGSASTPYWKFADNQWDVLGTTTGQNSSDQNVDRDLFGWGTSGYNHGADCYQPWNTTLHFSGYYAYGSYSYNLYDQTGQADWGYNPISNGGNQPNRWKTLTIDEWTYVFDSRTTSSGIRYAKANVNNVNGVILLPDDWSTSYYSLSNTNAYNASFSSNIITASQWNSLEQHGAVFLPVAGSRDQTSVIYVTSGYYWSASCGYGSFAWYMFFSDTNLLTDGYHYRYFGHSVRLVALAEN